MNCVSPNLALLELTMAIAKTLWSTDFILAPGFTTGEGNPGLGWGQRNPNEYVFKNSYLCGKYDLMIQFRSQLVD